MNKLLELKPSEIKVILTMFKDCDMDNFISKKSLHVENISDRIIAIALSKLRKINFIKNAIKLSGIKTIRKGYMINPSLFRKSRVVQEYFIMNNLYELTSTVMISRSFRTQVKNMNEQASEDRE